MENCAGGKRLLDKGFRYTPSVSTDIRKSFRRERARLAALREAPVQNALEAAEKVSVLRLRDTNKSR